MVPKVIKEEEREKITRVEILKKEFQMFQDVEMLDEVEEESKDQPENVVTNDSV